jgi:hypothetical protein
MSRTAFYNVSFNMPNLTSFIIAALIATVSCPPVTPNPQAEVTSSLEARAKINN